MKLSGFNKYFFDVVTESRDYLIFYISIFKTGRCYLAFLQLQWSVADPSGIYLSRCNLTSRIKLLNICENEIVFDEGRLKIKNDNIAVFLMSADEGHWRYLKHLI